MHIVLHLQIAIGDDVWSIYRRYSKFRQLHQDMKRKFPEVRGLAVINFNKIYFIREIGIVFFAFIREPKKA